MSKYTVMASWDDVPHLSEQDKAEILASIPPYQRDARSKGIPQLGAGAIYPISEDDILADPFELPYYWPRCFAMDVGWNKTAGLWATIDRENDIVFLYSEYYQGQAEPPVHAQGFLARGEWVPGVIDPSARQRAQKDGERLMSQYRKLGLNLTVADNAVEAGLYECWMRLSSGRLKVFRGLGNFLTEYRLYRRDENGKVVKERDHLMDCMRYLVMSGISRAIHMPTEQAQERMPKVQAKKETLYWADGR